MISRLLSHFRITAKLGEGGMGEVYRAEDTKLGREVAIKVLPAAVASDPERLARFEREAKLLASLNHPHIAAIHQVEEADGVHFLVMELVEGENLAERIAQGRIPVGEALPIAAQVAAALESAHEKGVVHRDLKPGNVMVTPDGQVKVLDFGLAKALAPLSSDVAATTSSHSPTLTAQISSPHVMLGTAAYMSPEQTRGRDVDRRTDIWAFGCLLFEMLTAKRAFPGATLSDTIAAILEREPPLDLLPGDLPVPIRRLLQRALAKDASRRLRDIGDARIEIDEAMTRPAGDSDDPRRFERNRTGHSGRLIIWMLSAVTATSLALATWAFMGQTKGEPPPTVSSRWVVSLETGLQVSVRGRSNPLALSPEGKRMVFAADRSGEPELYLRDMNRFGTSVVSGTRGARNPFFSPDGEWVGFFSGNQLNKVALQGGQPQSIATLPLDDLGGSWSPEGFIVFAEYGSGLSMVSANGGAITEVTTLDYENGEVQHRWPQILPDGEHVLFTVGKSNGSQIAIVSLETGIRRYIPGVLNVVRAWHAPIGMLIYAQAGGLMGVRLNLDDMQPRGNPISVLPGVASVPDLGNAYFAISESGAVAYVPGNASGETILAWLDRQGNETPVIDEPASYMYPRISPDGTKIAVTVGSELGTRGMIAHDLTRGTRTMLTRHGNVPSWNSNGTEILYSSNRDGSWNLYTATADGSDKGRRLLDREHEQWEGSWSPDGRTIVFYEVNPDAGRDIMIMPSDGGDPVAFVATPFNELAPRFSPNGNWITYVSNESGRDEVYVVPFPADEGKWTISTDGGSEPVWSHDGTELFYRQRDRMLSVRISYEPTFSADRPSVVFEGRYDNSVAGNANWDISPDGERFLMIKRPQDASPVQLHVVLNWFAELEQRAGHLLPSQ